MITRATTGVPYEPTAEQIAERARQVREEGFTSRQEKGKRKFNPPWNERRYYIAAGLPQPAAQLPCYNSSYSGATREVNFEASQ